jgi:hypothetical protein
MTCRTNKGRSLLRAHRVTGGGRPTPVPTERGMRIYRTTVRLQQREARALAGDRREGVQKVARRSRQRDHEHVAGVEPGEDAAELGAIGLRAARHLAEHLARAGGLELATWASMLWPPVDTRA